MLTACEVAELLHMPPSTVEHLARQGTLPSRKIGRRRLFVRHQVEAVLLGEAAGAGPEGGRFERLAEHARFPRKQERDHSPARRFVFDEQEH